MLGSLRGYMFQSRRADDEQNSLYREFQLEYEYEEFLRGDGFKS